MRPRPQSGGSARRPTEQRRRRSGSWIAAGVALAACLLGWLWLGRGEDLVDKTLDMERSLLAGEASGRSARRALDEIIRNVDRMSRDEVRSVQGTLDTDWRHALEADVDAYFAAVPAERVSILDRSIDRAVIYKELRFAMNPRAWGKESRRPRKPRSASRSQAAGTAAPESDSRRQLLQRYDDALRQRARERRIELPAWQ